MNASNRFEIETLARQRQLEIERYLRQASQVRRQGDEPSFTSPRVGWAVAAAALSAIGLAVLGALSLLF